MFEPTSPSSSSDSFVREIKERAQEAVQKEAKGASAMALLKTVRNQYLMAKELEMQGELEDALSALTKTASLANMIFGTAEFESEKAGKGGVLRREFISFLEKDGADLSKRTAAVEERLRAIEKERQKSQPTPSSPDTISKPGGSIADRMKALQSNGLSISTSKRISTQAQNIPSPSKPSADFSPSSPRISSSPSARPSPIALPAAPLSPLSAAPSISSLTSALNGTSISASSPSPHSFVSPSTFGPPSPSSSPSSSPKTSNYTLSEFNSHFPSIDELDEDPNFALPSVPTGLSTTSNKSSSSRSSKTGADAPLASPTPHAALRNFIVPMERPSSTPITPTNNLFNSRPASPSKPPVPLKPSNLSTSSSSASAVAHGDANHHVHPISQSPSYSNGVLSKPSIPKKNTATPRELKEYVRGYKVLLLDVRNRADFDKEHIKAPGAAVVCVEPTVLMRSNVTGESLEDSMVIAPAQEATAFKNRDKWDLVVVYDQKSIDFGGLDSLLNVLIGAISERAFKKPLRRMPMILVGGLDAWKAEMGLQEVEVSGTSGSGYSDGITSASASASTTSSASISSATAGPNTEYWTPPLSSSSSSSTVTATTRTRSETNPSSSRYSHGEHRGNYSVDQRSIHSRSPADSGYSSRFGSSPDSSLSRRPAISRAALSSTTLAQPIAENAASPSTNGASSITYPSFSRSSTSGIPSTSSTPFTSSTRFDIASPPQASISPSLSRRRSDYIDQSQEAVSGLQNRPIDYPELSTQVIRPPPAVASPALERQDNRPRLPSYSTSSTSQGQLKAPTPPRIESYWPVTYWADSRIGISGLRNLGNTCYMNAPIQCLSASPPFARFFNEGRWKSAINFTNTLGSKGKLTGAFAKLVHAMWANEIPHQTPHDFKHTICSLNSQYVGTDQHDSQEFLSFLLDGIHEDLNRVVVRQPWTKTPEEEAELEKLPPQIASEQEWRAWKARNDSVIVDYFQGQFRNQMKCLTCNKTSTTYNTFSILSVPIPSGRSGKMPLQRCLDAFFNTEVMEKDDAWDCPQCKQKQRASKQLSLARLPPILVIHLKRFEANGRFSDKIDTFVDFPLKSLDFTSYMPPPLPAGADHGRLNGGVPMSPDDPRSQMPPYKYDLYGVTNHTGNLSSGHYTAYVASGGGWKYCDDSTIKDVDHKQVVSQKAYVLFYKRTKA
ncbi:ubiquitin-specific protease [Moniliophthora roreri MCA 2997]|uniref:ubiquitinyl hydrolase 1 n=1 Tax=Moniliophthora roreri (strain MCA 2997) TaxID=1381753 RepID=V2X461_MONRO|nr:ubiquitin-specific protease [Moniliophthora roreri MCA 2997]